MAATSQNSTFLDENISIVITIMQIWIPPLKILQMFRKLFDGNLADILMKDEFLLCHWACQTFIIMLFSKSIRMCELNQ